MGLTTYATLITVGMFLSSLIRWTGKHWQFVLIRLIPLVGALGGLLELATGRTGALVVLSLVTNCVGFVLLPV